VTGGVEALASKAQDALVLATTLSLPIVLVAALVGLVVGVLQAATQVQDPTLAHLPRLLVVALALVLAGPWIGAQLVAYTRQILLGG
jgi:flagellar biosynthetic protein FliQ